MVKKTKSKARLDKFYHVAKEQGYRSRAAFKLIQINKKYNFLQNATSLIDLCAAPGGWLQVASKYMPGGSTLLGFDLAKIKPIPNCKTYVQDITTSQCLKTIKSELGGNKADVVLHDGAPNVGTSWNQDAYGQNELVLHSAALASKVLKKGGFFITKVFRSADYNSLIWVFQKLFDKVEANKPEASRNTSAEIFVVCQGYKAPEIIDQRFFDASFVFKNNTADLIGEGFSGVTSINKLLEKKRNRMGYAENAPQSLHKKMTLTDFIDCENPIPVFAEYNEIVYSKEELEKFSQLAKPPADLEETSKDLQVLGKPEIMSLIKWRKKIATKLEKSNKALENKMEQPEVPEKQDELEAKIKEAEKLEKLEHAKKEAKKEQLLTKKLARATDVLEDNDELYDFFKFKDIENFGYVDEDDNDNDENKAPLPKMYYNNLNEVEDNIEFLEKLKKEKKLKVKKHQEQREREKEEAKPFHENIDYFVPESKLRTRTAQMEQYDNEQRGNIKIRNTKFFDTQDFQMMKSAMNEFDDVTIKNPLSKAHEQDENESSEEESDEEQREIEKNKKILEGRKRKTGDLPSTVVRGLNEKPEKKVKKEEIEIAPRDKFEDMDIDELAETTALAKVMLRKKNRESIINSTYNKFNFGEEENLPSWFAEDELKHNYPILPISKDEFQYEKDRLMALNSKSSKKVLEAKFRKKRKLALKMKKAKSKAENILETEGLDERVKLNEIKKMYRKEANKDKKDKKYVTTKSFKSGKAKSSNNVKYVDKRLKKDKRALMRANKKSTTKKYKRR